jgi:hypothetical protein
MDNQERDITADSKETPPSISVYFIPLPDPLPMPQDLTMLFQYDDRNTPYVAGLGRKPAGPVDLLLGAGPLDVAVRLWMVPTYAVTDLMAMSAAVTVAEVVTGESQRIMSVDPGALIKDQGISNPTSLISVAEVAAYTAEPVNPSGPVMEESPEEIEIDDLTDPLLRSLNCIQHLVRAYRITADALVPEPTYQRMRPWVLTAKRAIDAKGPPKVHQVTYLSHKNLRDAPPRKLEEGQLLQWQSSVQLLSAKDPTALYRERMIDAEYSLTVAGDYGGAVIDAAMAAEVFLDSMLGLLHWERYGGAPLTDGEISRAVAALSKDLRPRIRSEYHPLIGGRWDLNANGPLQSWDAQVARVRNRIVHRGYRPGPSEAADALNSVNQLVNWVADLLCSKASQFPRTTSMTVPPDRMRRRNVPKRVIEAIDLLARTEPPWRDDYSAWRDRVDAAIVRRGR